MDDKEIIDRLKKADALLAEYVALVRPVAAELARQKSLAVFGREGCYDGELGCWEAGIDTICCHIRDDVPDGRKIAHSNDVAFDWEQAWQDKFRAAGGLHHVSLTGHY